MSEIADELERMAVELRELSEKHDAESLRNEDHLQMGRADGLYAAAERLRERAAELRAQSGGPTYKKPVRVEADQWWSFGGAAARSVLFLFPYEGQRYASFEDAELPPDPNNAIDVMLTDDRWLYLGNGERPAT